MQRMDKPRVNGMMSFCTKRLCITVMALAMGTNAAHAAYHNPFPTTPVIQLSETEKAAYIDQKTQTLFSAAESPKELHYIVPKRWQQDLHAWKQVKLEKYTSFHKKTDKVVLQLHGGGYIQGNHNLHRDWAIARAEAMGSGTVYMLNYRFYPDAKYPAALEDAVAAYQAMLRSGIPAKDIVVMGDSAGGNLALALALYLRDHNLAEPGCLALYSPWGDVGHLPSHDMNQEKDMILGLRNPVMNAAVRNNHSYFQDTDIKAPYVSPVYADFTGLPPILMIAGEKELFIDDCRLLEQRGREAGVPVETHVYPGMSHDWPILFPELPESRDTYDVLAKFIKKQ